MNHQRYEESVENYEKAKSILEKSLGAKHASVASTIQFIANVHLASGKFGFLNYGYFHKTIIILFFSFFAKYIWLHIFHCMDSIWGIILTNYINIKTIVLYRKTEALSSLKQSLDIFMSALGENHPNVVACYEMIGDISYDLKEYLFL